MAFLDQKDKDDLRKLVASSPVLGEGPPSLRPKDYTHRFYIDTSATTVYISSGTEWILLGGGE